MRLEAGQNERWDAPLAVLFGLGVACVAWLASPDALDWRVWKPICEGALLRPPELFQPGLGRLIAYALTRALRLETAVGVLRVLGPVTLGLIAYQAMRVALAVLMSRLQVDVVRTEFRTVMLPVLTAVGLGLFLLSWPVLHAAWALSPTLIVLFLAFSVLGALRNFLVASSLGWAYWGVFVCGVLSAESLAGWFLLLIGCGLAWRRVRTDAGGTFVLSNPYVFHVAKWVLTFRFFLGFGLTLGANAWFFAAHGGVWSAAFADFRVLPDLNAVVILTGLVAAPLVATLSTMPRSSDSERFLPYAHGMLLVAVMLVSVVCCCRPEIVPIENGCAKTFQLAVSSLTVVAALLTLLVDVYCRVGARYPKRTRQMLFRLLIVLLALVEAAMVFRDGTHGIAAAVDRCADEIVGECEGLKRLFSDGALDELVELKAAFKGVRLNAHSMLGGHDEPTANLRCRDVAGDDDVCMMRIGAPVALASWVATGSPELAKSATQLGLELWRRSERPEPQAGGLVVRPSGWAPEELRRARDWADDFARDVLSGTFARDYERCREKRLREAFDMAVWRVGRLLEARAREVERTDDHAAARVLRQTAGNLDRRNGSLAELHSFMNLVWNQDNLQLTPRESLKIALDRANFRAARPHAEAILSSDPGDAAANFALGMYYYVRREFARAEGHFIVAHQSRPKDAAILNNLALVEMYLGKLDAAEAHAQEALSLKPGVREIESALREIRERREKRPASR